MSKRIILLSDGTGNSAAKVWRTNVWRTFESLDLTQPDQIAIYDDGVGTSSFKPAAVLGGAFGFGLKRNVLSLYKFLCRNYCSNADYKERGIDSEDDEIFAFGFSRGAFTIRVLVGFVLDQGLVKYRTEAELNEKARAAYRAHREKEYKTNIGTEVPFRKIRNLFVSSVHNPNERPVAGIRFLGLWDTVAAYGLPVDEMTYGISRYVWPLEFADRRPSPKVARACHALSLDDERTTFHPVLWDETGIDPVPPNDAGVRLTKKEKVSQVWFAGVHANVGGGYPDDSLAHVPLNWILKEAQDCGLRFKPGALAALMARQDPDGRLYDSRGGIAGYYRYGPRNVTDLCDFQLSNDKRDQVLIDTPKIHETAFRRLKDNAHLYAPVSLPDRYEIVKGPSPTTPDPVIVAPASPAQETPDEAKKRYAHQENIVWSYVWRRRVIYFLTVLASLHLVIYPLSSTLPASAELETRLRPLADLIRLVSVVLPSGLDRWIKAYAADPAWFIVSAAAVAGLMWASTQIKVRLTDEMTANWKTSLNCAARKPLPSGALSPYSHGILHWIVFAILCAIAIYAPLTWFVPHMPGQSFGWLQRLTDWFIWLLVFLTLVVLLLPTKSIARFRTKSGYKRTVQTIKRRIAPATFAILLPLLGLALASHYIFNFRDSFGSICQETRPNGQALRARNGGLKICSLSDRSKCPRIEFGESTPPKCGNNCTGKVLGFDTADICTPTGVFLEKNATYRIEVSQRESPAASAPAKWTFAWTPSTTKGMPLSAFDPANSGLGATIRAYAIKSLMFAMYPLKRTFDRPWGHVIIRYGSTGNEENFLDPGEGGPPYQRAEAFTPKRSGELFVYLNQPVLGLWPAALGFINSGKGTVTVTRIPR